MSFSFSQGCRSPLVVKFADTPKDKEMKKLQSMNQSLISMANLAGLGALGPQYMAVSVFYYFQEIELLSLSY